MSEYRSGELLEDQSISELYDRSLNVYGIKIVAGANVGGSETVPDTWIYKTARLIQLLLNRTAPGIDPAAQERVIKILKGESGTFHSGLPTLQRVLVGGGENYDPNPLSDEGANQWNGLNQLNDSHVSNDMVWYRNSNSPDPPTGRNDINEILEHVLHTIQMLGLRGAVEGSFQGLDNTDTSSELRLAMAEAVDNGVFDLEGYGGSLERDEEYTAEVIVKEYLYLLTFGMWDFSEFWDGGSLAPEWSDSARTPEGILNNNPLGHELFTKYISPVLSKPSKATLLEIFQDNDQGPHGYLADSIESNSISIIVDENVVSDSAMLVAELDEKIIRNGDEILSHTIEYENQLYNYQEVDALIMVYVRNNTFSKEFQAEIAESFPDYSTVTYEDVISLVGLAGVNDAMLQVAAADGFFVA